MRSRMSCVANREFLSSAHHFKSVLFSIMCARVIRLSFLSHQTQRISIARLR